MIPKLANIDPVQQRYLDFLEALRARGFSGDISPEYGHRTVLSTDNSVYQMLPQAVVYPRSTEDLSLLSELADESTHHGITLSARGGGTGTNGQSLNDGLVVDLSRHMNHILEINVEERWVKVQAGVVKDQLNAALKPHGLFFAPELSTSNRATIGGMINTDASGQGSCLYGKTRDHVLELKTVLLGGEVLHSRALEDEERQSHASAQTRSGLVHRLIHNIGIEHKEAIEAVFPPLNRCLTGYDLAHIHDEQGRLNLNNILCGSEGTLGFISEAKLNVLPIPKCSALVVVKYGDFEASLRDATELMNTGPTSIETIDSTVLNLAMNDFIWHQVESFFDDATPVPVQGINLVEFAADTEDALNAAMRPLLAELEAQKYDARIGFALAMGSDAVNRIWAMRKRAVGLLGNVEGEARPVPFVEDTAVPPEHLADFIMEFRAILDAHQLRYGMFGHVDAGVLHVRPALDMKDPDQEALAWQISDQVAALTKKYHGLLWGEHGKGVRSEYAPAFFGELYPQLQRIKAAFDPRNQLNPGKIATPDEGHDLLRIAEVPTRGDYDRAISQQSWQQFSSAVYCNGNGACHNWNFNDAMCPSWKGTRLRTHTPKGRASLVKEWLRQLSLRGYHTTEGLQARDWYQSARTLPAKIRNTWAARRGEQDFSHEVYDSMAACLACKSCTGQCPIKVDVPEFRSQFLALYHTRYLRPLKDYLVASLEHILPAAARWPSAYNLLSNNPLSRTVLKHLAGFVDGPRLSNARLLDHIDIVSPEQLSALDDDARARSVVLVQDAFTRYFDTEMLIDVVEVIKGLGFTPYLAPYRANGKPLHVHGFLHAFRRTAKQNVAMLKTLSDTGVALVGIDPSMTLTYRGEYRKHLDSADQVEVMLLQEWLSQHLDHLKRIQAAKPDASLSLALLPHCTEKTNASASSKQWQQIFEALGMTLDVVATGCCGMAGTFGHEARNRDTSKTLYDLSWRPNIEQRLGKQELLATGYSCRCQVKREQDLAIKHPLQALRAFIHTPH